MSAPLISVILPTYKRGELIARALRSVLAQTHTELEVLILDDVPGDRTEEVVKSFRDPRLRYLSHPTRRGVAAARNQGLALARGEFVAFQDSDDEWLVDKLAHQLARLRSLGDEVALTQAAIIRCEGHAAGYFLSELPADRQREAILAINDTTFLQGWLARRAPLSEVGGFDERIRLWEDWELLIRLCQKYRVDVDERPVALVHDTPASLIRQQQWRAPSLAVILSKHAALMREHRAAMAVNLYALGRFQLLDGQAALARRTLLGSLRRMPLRLKTWLLLALSLFGRALVQRVVRWREGRMPELSS